MKRGKKLLKGITKRKSAAVKSSSKKKKLLGAIREERAEKAFLTRLPRVSINARRRAYSKNTTVTIIRKGKIIKIYPDKHEVVIGTVKKIALPANLPRNIKIK